MSRASLRRRSVAEALQAYSNRIKAKPTNGAIQAPTHFRVRQDKVDETGKVSLRYHSKLYKSG